MARSSTVQRTLDRYFGIPAIFLLGLFRRRGTLPASPRRIGLIQPSAIGDMLLISGLVMHLRRRFPAAEIHIFHGPFNGGAVQLLPVDVVAHRCVFTGPLATLRELRNAKLDILINCAPWTRLTAFLTALSGAKATVGFRSPGQFIHAAFDVAVPYASDRHEVDNHRAIAELFGPLPKYFLQLRKIEQPAGLTLPYDRLVLMHLMPGGSAARQKSWPADRWAELARRLVERGWTVGFTGADADRDAIASVLKSANLPADRCLSLAGRLNLAELSYVLSRSRLLVTVDTGVAHLAAALDCAVVGLHGPTTFARWGAWNARSIGVESRHPAAGYINYGFERHPQGDEIMACLSVDAVSDAVLGKLDKAEVEAAS